MEPAERRRYTADEYMERERAAATKSELVNGEIFAMAGAKPKHNVITANVIGELRSQLRAQRSPCVVFPGDQRIHSDVTEIYTYADASVACGPRFHAKHTDTLVNPTVIVEVLSKSTEGYDRGAKFAHYETIPTFMEYVLVSQRTRRVEHFRRIETGQWLRTVLEGDAAVLELPSIGCTLPLEEIYAQTDELEGDPDEGPTEPRRAG
jgi:Uma2 family endonuclease